MTPGQLTLTLPPTPRAFAGLPSLMGSGAVFFVLSAPAQIVSESLTGQNELTSQSSGASSLISALKHMTKIERTARYYDSMSKLGFSYSEAQSLRRIEMTLHRWGELECGDGNDYSSWGIERDEQTNVPYMVTYPHTGKSYKRQIPDREAGALKRLAKIMEKHPELWSYHQTDPRGCQLYIGRKDDLKPGDKLDSLYTRGFAVCI